eukprot:TRINITY_DN4924_c0_g5_i1.p1 TRINITY_DN4924_c0_g5~~TRINITY_DN4924_c0_g5_i1.p1  ORF type:complete len:140 (-),score=3.81 TRINITY_DN4924_c0_g5_i1:359-778(-)
MFSMKMPTFHFSFLWPVCVFLFLFLFKPKHKKKIYVKYLFFFSYRPTIPVVFEERKRGEELILAVGPFLFQRRHSQGGGKGGREEAKIRHKKKRRTGCCLYVFGQKAGEVFKPVNTKPTLPFWASWSLVLAGKKKKKKK